ncbi:glycosyltransferase family 8 protein [Calocera viscosa TUFC12733]|uniref:Glycosyltransferase family 8 protein n=1 Tax=Calocera viscosa (strain TUFC12733) TaxID=1330018 RepID=A0A167P734_CALVF|nr:glycosyltransferase family 8 protein [Calocera viscosa TUFC12733]
MIHSRRLSDSGGLTTAFTPRPGRCAWVTLITKSSYLAGVITLAQTFREVGSAYPLVVFCTPQLPARARRILAAHDIQCRDVQPLMPKQGAYEWSGAFKRFEETWNKLRVFELDEYDRVVLMDSDMVVLRNMDELMTMPLPSREWVAAAHVCACNPRKLAHYPADWVPKNCAHTSMHARGLSSLANHPDNGAASPRPYGSLNSGLVVLHPNVKTAEAIQTFLNTSPLVPTFQFPDQDLLSEFFRGRWRPLPYVYNALKTLSECHTPMWRTDEVRCLHYILEKPWENREGLFHDIWWDKWVESRKTLTELCGEKDDEYVAQYVTAK